MKKKRQGRPPICGKPRDRQIHLRVTDAERTKIAAFAKHEGVSVATVIREGLKRRGVDM